MTSSFDTLIFDLGGLLIDYNPRYLYRKIFATEEEIDHFLSTVCTHDWNVEQDGGRPLATATRLLIDQYPELESEISAFYDRWEEMLGGPIAATVDLLTELKDAGSHRLLALTNWSGETFPIARKRFKFLSWFEGILVSGDEHLKKPDPAIYQLLLDRYQVNPERAVFVDDSLPNVLAAAEFGIHAIHFQSAAQFRSKLAALNIISPNATAS